MALSYVLPIRTQEPMDAELLNYLRWLTGRAEVIVVDGSPPEVFDDHADRCSPHLLHIVPDEDLRRFANGKVAGVVTGVRRASHELVIIADDDVRYDAAALSAIERALGRADVVRPQNYFDPRPWHTRIDTARTLLNRMSGGDWPGTLGVKRSLLVATGGYDGDVLFENLELVRTVKAAGGTEAVPLDLFVRRLPPTARGFWSQRVRQAYDELARPVRLVFWLAILPAALTAAAAGRWRILAGGVVASIAAAEAGRRRGAGRCVFAASATLVAPLWIAERAICAWLAVGMRLFRGGVSYRGRIIAKAATPRRQLEARYKGAYRDHPRAMTKMPHCPSRRL